MRFPLTTHERLEKISRARPSLLWKISGARHPSQITPSTTAKIQINMFFTTWCGHCTAMKPQFVEMAEKRPGSTTTTAWNIEDAKKALLKVKLTEADEQGVRKVGKNSLAEAIHGSATPGKVAWSNVMRRGCALPLPASSKFQQEGSKQTADVFYPSDVP